MAKIESATVPCSLSLSDETPEFDATGTGLTVGETHVIAAWLKRSQRTTKIRSLTLAGNELSGSQRQESDDVITWSAVDTALSGVRALCNALNDGDNSIGVTHLDLANCGLGAQSVLLIAQALCTDGSFRRSAERIILDGNYVTDSRYRVHTAGENPSWLLDHDTNALQTLGQSLQYAPSLGTLSLVGCQIGPAALTEFANSVPWPSIALKSLELGGNPFSTERKTGSDVGALETLCAQLAHGSQLEHLGLDRVGCGPISLPHISTAAHAMPSLKNVNLSGNVIGILYTRPVVDADVHETVRKGCIAAYENRFGEVMRDPDADGEVKLRWLHSSAESEWIDETVLAPVVDSLSEIVSDYSHIEALAATLHTLEQCDLSYCGFDKHSIVCLTDSVRWTDPSFSLKGLDVSGNTLGQEARESLSAKCEEQLVQVDVAKSKMELEKLSDEEAKAAAAYRKAAKLDEESQEAERLARERVRAAEECERQATISMHEDEVVAAEVDRKLAEAEAASQEAESRRLAAEKQAAAMLNDIVQQQVAEAQLMEAQDKTKKRFFHHVNRSDKKRLEAAEKAFQASAIMQVSTMQEDDALNAAKRKLASAKSARARKVAQQELDACEYRAEMKKKDLLAREMFKLQDQQEIVATNRAQALSLQKEAEAVQVATMELVAADKEAEETAKHDLDEAKEMITAAKTKQEAALQARIEADREGMKGLGLARQARKAREYERQLAIVDSEIDDDVQDEFKVQCGLDCLTGALSTPARQKLTLFSILAVLAGFLGLLCAAQTYQARIPTLAYFNYMIAVGAVLSPVAGIYGAMQRIESVIRAYAFVTYLLVCGYLAIGTSLVLQQHVLNSGNTDLQAASQQLQESVDNTTGVVTLAFVSALLAATTAYLALRLFCAWIMRRDDQSHWMDHPKADIRRANQVIFVSGWYSWFEMTQLAVVCLLLYLLAIQSPTISPKPEDVFSSLLLELFVSIFLTTGCVIDAFMMPGNTRVRWCATDSVHAFDAICVVSSWLFIVWPQNQLLALVRCLRVIRPMVALAELEALVDEIHAVTLIAMTFKGHASLYQTLVMFIIFSLLCCCIVGVNMYEGAIQYTCDASEVSSTATGYLCPAPLAQPRWWGSTPPCGGEDSQCYRLDPPRELLGGDDTGKRGFDSVPQAFMTLLVHISGDGGMNDLPAALLEAGASSSEFAWSFFAFLVVILHWIILNMLLAMGVYTLGNAEQTVKAHAREVADAGVKVTGKVSLGTFEHKASAVNFDADRSQLATSLEELDWAGSTFCTLKVGSTRNKIKQFAMSNRFRNTVVIMVLLWTGVLMTKTGGESATSAADVDNWSSVRQILELVLLVGFMCEIVVGIVGFGVRRFFTSPENVLDFLVCVITCAGFITSYFGFLVEIKCGLSAAKSQVYISMSDANDTLQDQDTMTFEMAKSVCVDEAISDSTLKFFRVMRITQVRDSWEVFAMFVAVIVWET